MPRRTSAGDAVARTQAAVSVASGEPPMDAFRPWGRQGPDALPCGAGWTGLCESVTEHSRRPARRQADRMPESCRHRVPAAVWRLRRAGAPPAPAACADRPCASQAGSRRRDDLSTGL